MKDIEQYLREIAPETPEEGQFLIETNSWMSEVEGIKDVVDGEHRHWRKVLLAALCSGLVIGCVGTLVLMFCPVRPAVRDWSAYLLFGIVAVLAIGLGAASITKKRESL